MLVILTAKEKKKLYDANWRKENPEKTQRYWQNYYQGHKKELNEKKRERDLNNPQRREKKAETNKKWREALKLETFNAYGGCICVCCGEVNLGFLTLDHINGCPEGRKRKDTTIRLYSKLKQLDYPRGFQVLCYNCNLGRAHHGGICPHHLGR